MMLVKIVLKEFRMSRPHLIFKRWTFLWTFCLLVATVGLAQASAPTATVTVCSTIFCTFNNIQTAIDVSAAGTHIFLLDAVHTEAGIVVDKDVTIEGFGHTQTTVQAASSLGNATDRVFKVNSDTVATIRNMTIQFGQAPHATFFTFNGDHGGGIRNDGHLTLDSVRIAENSAGDGWPCSTSGCTGGSGGSGGAIYNASIATLILINSSLTGNQTGDGGDCTAEPFCKAGQGGHGGAIYNAGQLQIVKSGIYTNQTGMPGGCTSSACADPEVDMGGGIYNDNGFIYIRNTTIGNNSAADEVGISSNPGAMGAKAILRNVTITKNQLRDGATGIGGIADNAGEMAFFNSIVADNEGTQCRGLPNIFTTAVNLASDASCTRFSLPQQAADLHNLGFYAGTQMVSPPEWNSLAVGRGSDCEVGDQRGFQRSPLGAVCDLGAYEKLELNLSSQNQIAIPDNSTVGIEDTLINSTAGTVVDPYVSLQVTHPAIGDLVAELRTPGALDVALFDRIGFPTAGGTCTGDDINASFYDGLTNLAEFGCEASPPSLFGNFQPAQPLSEFRGRSTAANWSLHIRDIVPQNAGGTLDSWLVGFDYAPDVSAETITNATVSASQMYVGPGDSFYYRLDLDIGSNGWSSSEGTLFTAEIKPTYPATQTIQIGTPIVPDGSGITCIVIGSSIGCGGTNGSLLANSTHTFYVPVTNPTSGGCSPDAVFGQVNEAGGDPFDMLVLPLCISQSQGSTFPPGQSAPTAVGLNGMQARINDGRPLLIIVTGMIVMIATVVMRQAVRIRRR